MEIMSNRMMNSPIYKWAFETKEQPSLQDVKQEAKSHRRCHNKWRQPKRRQRLKKKIEKRKKLQEERRQFMTRCASHSKGVLYYSVDVCNRARDLNRSIADTESVCSDSLFIDVSKILEHGRRSPQADPLTPNALLDGENDAVPSEERPS